MSGVLNLLTGWKGYAASALIALIVGAGASWKIQSWRYDARIARIETGHAQVIKTLSQSAERAQAEARAEEQRRINAIEEIRHDADKRIQDIIERERAAVDLRLRDAIADYASRHSRAPDDPGVASNCEAARTAAGVLAQLLGELDRMAEDYAAQADRAREAGLNCQASYDALD